MKPIRSFNFHALATVIFFPIILFAWHLLLRGHDAPGGGFIAGAGTALSLVLLGLAIGVERLRQVVRFDPVRIATIGLLIVLGVAILPLFRGDELLTQYHAEFPGWSPVLGSFSLSTALIFDLGIYLLVAGAMLKTIQVLMRSIARIEPFTPDEKRRYAAAAEEQIEQRRSRRGTAQKKTKGGR